jgi:hypothetical protein
MPQSLKASNGLIEYCYGWVGGFYIQSERQQQFSWSHEVSPDWKQGVFPSADWIDLTMSSFFILLTWRPIFFAITLITFTVIFISP